MQRSTLLLILVAAVLALGVFAALQFGGGDDSGGGRVVLLGDGTSSTALTPNDAPRDDDLDARVVEADDLSAPPEEAPPTVYGDTLQVYLDLVRPAGQLHAQGHQAMGSGATAELIGGLWTSARAGVRGTVRFVSGANEGRVLECDAGGRFGANDLYPGISVVEVTGPGIPGSLRELLLRNGRETRLNIGYGRLSTVNGEVVDHAGEPIVGAVVRFDGVPIETDVDGRFTLQGIAGSHGDMVVTVDKEGFVPLRTKVSLMSGSTVPFGQHRFVLKEPGSLEVFIAERIGAAGTAQLYLMPANAMRGTGDYAWHRRNPITVQPGSTTVIDGLPPMEVRAMLFHAGAVAKPRVATAVVRAGKATAMTFHLDPAPMIAGKVTFAGSPVARAVVRLEAPDRSQAVLNYLGESAAYLETQVVSTLPPGAQAVKTDDLGNFRIGWFGDADRPRYLTATSFDGKQWAGRVVSSDTREVTLELEPARHGDRTLEIALADRELPLMVDVQIDGAPQDPRVVRPNEQLQVHGLMEGDWRLSVRWKREWLVDQRSIRVQDGAEVWLDLPGLGEPVEQE